MVARRRLVWMSLALSVGLLALVLGTTQPQVDSARGPGASTPPPTSAPLVARITVSPTRSGPPVVRAQLGQLVELAVTPSQPDAISIVGMDRTHAGSPSTPARFSLVAVRAGRFPLVLESSGQTVGLLEVGMPPPRPVRRRAS